ncbi:MAG TPA: hypothetical protein VN822_12920 [Candidatus Acidoferrales bacterium]|nr:hypothetical protein [Candidatus Acidoferrales bacterium]
MKQPLLGIVASLLVIAVSLGFIALFAFPIFGTWVAFLTICFIPMQIVISVTWGCKHPGFAATRTQPAKGILLTLMALVVGAIVAAVHFSTVNGGINPPTPMLAMCIIASVVVTFWLAIMWGGWPFDKLIKNPIGAGLAMLASCYIINYALFRLLFNYGFMQGAPVYVPALDPHGLFNAWNALVFYITATGAMFLSLNFDLWPFTVSPAVMKQPVLGIVWTITALVIGTLAFYLGVKVMGMDVVVFMVSVPIPFIFGTIIVLNMMHGSLFGKLAQPLKGVLNAIASAVIGVALARIYGVLAPVVTGAVKPGPPSYDFEIWLASALLAVTFPFLIFYAEFFKMWPLHREPAQAKAAPPAD